MDKWYIKMSNIIHIVKFTGPILEDLARIATLVFDQVVMNYDTYIAYQQFFGNNNTSTIKRSYNSV